MKSQFAACRYLFFQSCACLEGLCLLITFISVVKLNFSIGLFELLALFIPLIGLVCYVLNANQSRRQKVIQDYYMVGSVSTILSLVFTAQVLIRFTLESAWLEVIFFLILLVPTMCVGYFILMTHNRLLLKTMQGPLLIVTLLVICFLSYILYRFVICFFFAHSTLQAVAYVMGLLGVLICLVLSIDVNALLSGGK